MRIEFVKRVVLPQANVLPGKLRRRFVVERVWTFWYINFNLHWFEIGWVVWRGRPTTRIKFDLNLFQNTFLKLKSNNLKRKIDFLNQSWKLMWCKLGNQLELLKHFKNKKLNIIFIVIIFLKKNNLNEKSEWFEIYFLILKN